MLYSSDSLRGSVRGFPRVQEGFSILGDTVKMGRLERGELVPDSLSQEVKGQPGGGSGGWMSPHCDSISPLLMMY